MATESTVPDATAAGFVWEMAGEQKYTGRAFPLTVAYIANEFPAAVEPYVIDEIGELRRRGVRVVPCSVRRPSSHLDPPLKFFADETLYLLPPRAGMAVRAAWLCWKKRKSLKDLARAAWREQKQPVSTRIRALLHLWVGAYYSLCLAPKGVKHIHAHHGYCGSWIAMVAARLLGISFSLTLHGSDLLLHSAFLEPKLENCKFCLTISAFNRRNILEHYPRTDPAKVMVHRLGVALPEGMLSVRMAQDPSTLVLLSVGRLHPVKDHAFLIRACRQLQSSGLGLVCLIAGEGPERLRLERLIRDFGLQAVVKLLGHLPRHKLDAYYAASDLVVLTSRSEGVPLVLMEAMAHGRPVLAPAITGIPELVQDGRTGFLYRAGALDDFAEQVRTIRRLLPALGPMRRAARENVLQNFNRDKNLLEFGDLFLTRVTGSSGESRIHEDSFLQQIQL
jgi:colanic acid/amylovoran biosynthesis glycosyltransferase